MIAAKAKEPGKAKAEAPGQKTKQQPVSSKEPAFNPVWEQLALGVQAKLAVSAPDDPYEREADRVAEQVMRMPDASSSTHAASLTSVAASTAQRKCSACEEENKLQRKQSEGAPDAPVTAPPVVQEALSAPGQPLDAATRGFFEPRFGHDFSDVRVHTDGRAAEAARAIDARAFAFGSDVVFDAGEYSPRSSAGKRLLAHELTHVAQQGAAPTRVWRDRRPPLEIPERGAPTKPFSTGTPVKTEGHTKKPDLDLEYSIEVVPGVGPDQRPKSVALLKYERKVWIRNKRGDEVVLRIDAHSDLNPPFDPKQTNFTHLKAPGFSNFHWEVDIKYSKATTRDFNQWHTTDDGTRQRIAGNDQSLRDLAAMKAPPYAQFFLSEEDQVRTLEKFTDRKAAEEIPEFKREQEEQQRRLEEWKKKHTPVPLRQDIPDPHSITDQQFQRLSPDQRRDLAWRAFKDEFSVSNVARNLAMTAGVMGLGALAIATGSPVLLGAAIAAVVVGGALIIYDTVNDVADRWKDGDHAGAVLSLLKGLAYLGGLVAAVLGAPVLALGLVVAAIGIGSYLAHRDYERAVEAKKVTEFRRAIQRAARGVEGAIGDGLGAIIAGGLGRLSKWFGGAKQPKAPTDVTPRPGAPPEPPATPEPPKPAVPTEPPKPAVPTEPPKPVVPPEPPKPAVPTEPPKPAAPTEPPKPAAPTEPPKPAAPTEPPMTAEPTVTLSPEELRLQQLGDDLEIAKEQLNKANQRLKELEKQGKDKFSLEHREQQKKFSEATDKYVKSKNRLEAERRAQGISPRQLYERLRGRTPNAEMTRVAASKPSPYGAGVSPDHIIPVIDIVEMPGFERLPPNMQAEVLNNVPENTIGVDPRVNSSKGDKLWSAKPGSNRYWEGYADFGPIPPEARQVMVQAEAQARTALQKAIQERLQKLGL